jgi:hypothetical protein
MAGIILTLWNPQVMNLLVSEDTKHTLSVNMQFIGNMKVIVCTNIYGPQMLEDKEKNAPRPRKPKSLFQQTPLDPRRRLQYHHDTCEKKGGNRRLDRNAKDFSTFIDTMEMVDIKTNNGQFTWNNKQINHVRKERP